jgi:hypothetical protein
MFIPCRLETPNFSGGPMEGKTSYLHLAKTSAKYCSRRRGKKLYTYVETGDPKVIITSLGEPVEFCVETIENEK